MKLMGIKKYFLLAGLIAMAFLQSCKNDPDPVLPNNGDGFFIVNEGAFGHDNASISFFDQKTETITNDLFIAKNGNPLGDQAQSMTIFNGKGYVVVQGTGKIEVINVDDFSSVTTITEGIVSPRYVLVVDSLKAYISDWGIENDGAIKVLDLKTNKITKTIEIGQGTNRMLKVGSQIYVTNAGGYGEDNTVKIVDSKTDVVTTTIEVGTNPNSLQVDKNGAVWVVSGGALAYTEDYAIDVENSTPGSVTKIKSDNTVAFTTPINGASYNWANNLAISPEGDQLYYTFDGAIYKMSITSTTTPATPLKSNSYYGLAVNPFNGNIIGCTANNFSSAGSIDIMDPSGIIKQTLTVGIAPNGCAFK